jgi:hypothetical protein
MISDTAATLAALRKLLLFILLIGMTGTLTELLILRHVEDLLQLIPVVLIGVGYVVLGWHGIRRSRGSIAGLQIVMMMFVVSGILGMFLHYRANVEFQLELQPELSGTDLFWKVLEAKTPPALSPGVMAQLGLIGFAYAYRHPAFAPGLRILEENRDE